MVYRLGFFKDVKLEEISSYTFMLLYKSHVGPYHQILEDLQSVEVWAKKNKIDCEKTFGEFLDNPDQTPVERLRSNVGCIVTEKLVLTADDPVQFKTMEHSSFLLATFEGSPAIGPMKVYPKAMQWAQKNKVEFQQGVIEVYTVEDDNVTTEFFFPIK
jgi:AraC family transcriptional regulator